MEASKTIPSIPRLSLLASSDSLAQIGQAHLVQLVKNCSKKWAKPNCRSVLFLSGPLAETNLRTFTRFGPKCPRSDSVHLPFHGGSGLPEVCRRDVQRETTASISTGEGHVWVWLSMITWFPSGGSPPIRARKTFAGALGFRYTSEFEDTSLGTGGLHSQAFRPVRFVNENESDLRLANRYEFTVQFLERNPVEDAFE